MDERAGNFETFMNAENTISTDPAVLARMVPTGSGKLPQEPVALDAIKCRGTILAGWDGTRYEGGPEWLM